MQFSANCLRSELIPTLLFVFLTESSHTVTQAGRGEQGEPLMPALFTFNQRAALHEGEQLLPYINVGGEGTAGPRPPGTTSLRTCKDPTQQQQGQDLEPSIPVPQQDLGTNVHARNSGTGTSPATPKSL